MPVRLLADAIGVEGHPADIPGHSGRTRGILAISATDCATPVNFLSLESLGLGLTVYGSCHG